MVFFPVSDGILAGLIMTDDDTFVLMLQRLREADADEDGEEGRPEEGVVIAQTQVHYADPADVPARRLPAPGGGARLTPRQHLLRGGAVE